MTHVAGLFVACGAIWLGNGNRLMSRPEYFWNKHIGCAFADEDLGDSGQLNVVMCANVLTSDKSPHYLSENEHATVLHYIQERESKWAHLEKECCF